MGLWVGVGVGVGIGIGVEQYPTLPHCFRCPHNLKYKIQRVKLMPAMIPP